MHSQLQDALSMFVFLTAELSALFIAISLLVGGFQRHIPPSKVEELLISNRSSGYFLAVGLGAITPFCSCSTIPMLKGLIKARAGFGPMMVFLFSSPLLNPIIIVLMGATFGLNLTAIYFLAALGISLGAGWLLHTLGFERYVRRADYRDTTNCNSNKKQCGDKINPVNLKEIARCSTDSEIKPASTACCSPQSSCASTVHKSRYSGLWREVWSDFWEVFPYLLVGVAIGSAIYGFMPTNLLERYAGPNNPFAILIAAVIGIPLYIRAEAVIPLAAALLAKGVGAGTVLALIIGSAGASLTELILLRSLFTMKILVAFVAVIIFMAIVAGYFTFLFF